MRHNDEPLIHINVDDDTFVVNKRVWTFGNFSKFIRPGFVRVDAETLESDNIKITSRPDPEVVLPPRDTIKEMFRKADPAAYISAYKNPENGQLVIVCVNDTDENVDIETELLKKGTFEVYRTSEDENLQKIHDTKAKDGKLSILLRPKSVTTYVSKEE